MSHSLNKIPSKFQGTIDKLSGNFQGLNLPQSNVLLFKGLGKIHTVHGKRHINTLSAHAFVFVEHLNFPLGTSKTVM